MRLYLHTSGELPFSGAFDRLPMQTSGNGTLIFECGNEDSLLSVLDVLAEEVPSPVLNESYAMLIEEYDSSDLARGFFTTEDGLDHPVASISIAVVNGKQGRLVNSVAAAERAAMLKKIGKARQDQGGRSRRRPFRPAVLQRGQADAGAVLVQHLPFQRDGRLLPDAVDPLIRPRRTHWKAYWWPTSTSRRWRCRAMPMAWPSRHNQTLKVCGGSPSAWRCHILR